MGKIDKKKRLNEQLRILNAKPKENVSIDCVGSFKDKYKELKRKKSSFTMLLKPNYTKFSIEGRSDVKYNKKGFNYTFMGLLSLIKADIRRCVKLKGGIDVIPVYTHKNIRYCFYGKNLTCKIPSQGEVIEYFDAVEYDISKAYFQAAYNLGYISQEGFDKCTDVKVVKKKDRLRLLGAIATQGELFVFKNGVEIDHKTIADELMRRVWFHICKEVDNCLMEFTGAVSKGLYMYWVDGILFKKSCLKEAESFMLYAGVEYNFEFKHVTVNKVEIKHNKGGRLCIYVHKEGKLKEFLFPVNKR